MRKPRKKKHAAAAAQRRGQILSVLCSVLGLGIEKSICFQVPHRDHEECVQMLRDRVHKKWEHDEDYDPDMIDGFLDRIIADPTAFLPIFSLKLTAARIAKWQRVRAQAIKEKGLSEPVREIVEYKGKDETRVQLTGSNGKSVLIHITLETLQ